MFIQMLMKEKRFAQLYTLIIFLVLALVFLAVTYFIQVNTDNILRYETEVNERNLVKVEKAAISSKINRRVADILFIADSLKLSLKMLPDFSKIDKPWIAFSNRHGNFDQIRYIDKSGDEIIRVNYSADGAYAVAPENLQNKAGRYYFTNTMSLAADDVFVSELDLNIEDGQIELPIKPTLRLATPIYSTSDSPDGVVVLNYLAEDMLAQVRSIASSGIEEVYLLNLDGYWLYNSADSALEWAFMYDDRTEESFASVFPLEWETIRTGDGDGFFVTGNGVFTYASISLEAEIAGNSEQAALYCSSGSFYIVSFISAQTDTGLVFTQSTMQRLGRVVMKYLSIYILLTGVAFALAAFIAVGRAQKKEIKFFSEYDALTGVFNRRAGYRKLQSLKKNVASRDCEITVCFIDINGLKVVNDTLGHDAGDALIKAVAWTIRDSVRGNDFIARLGGDEFLIVFDRLDAPGAETVWSRIVSTYEKINAEENREYLISVSHGIGVFRCNEEVSIDEIISRADEKMYEEKRRMKKGLSVIRGPKTENTD